MISVGPQSTIRGVDFSIPAPLNVSGRVVGLDPATLSQVRIQLLPAINVPRPAIEPAPGFASGFHLVLEAHSDRHERTAKERIELIKSAGEDVFKIMLPLIDDFERALKANENATDVKAINEGVNLIYQKLKTSFTSRGLEEMKAFGEEFNPDLHEAITNIPAPSEDMKGKIVEVMEKGYLLNGKVVRFAKVIIGN